MQATNERGRVTAKVHHSLGHLALNVPDDDILLDLVSTAHKPLAGHVVFPETDGRTARKTLVWEAGHWVSYHKTFAGRQRGSKDVSGSLPSSR